MLNVLLSSNQKWIDSQRDRWLQLSLGPGDVDQTVVTGAVHWLYRLAGAAPPERVAFTRGPTECQETAASLLQCEMAEHKEAEILWFPPQSKIRQKLRDTIQFRWCDPVCQSIRKEVGDKMWAHLQDRAISLSRAIRDEIWTRAKDQMRSRFLREGKRWVVFSNLGLGFDSDWCWFYDLFIQIGLLQHGSFLRYQQLLVSGVWDCILTKSVAVVCPRPQQVVRDERGRLHNLHGPAVEWSDGTKGYFVEGMPFSDEFIENPTRLTASIVLSERNAEIRRCLIEIMGKERFVASARARIVHEDQDGAGCPRRLLQIALPRDAYLMYVQVQCPSTGRQYFLRVPPDTRTCDQAVAWTFHLQASAYRPIVET